VTSVRESRVDLLSGVLLLVMGFVLGMSFFFAEIALAELPPLTMAFHRMFWAVPVLFIVVRILSLEVPRNPEAWRCYLVMGALNNAIPFSLIVWGQTNIESGIAAILVGTTAVFSAVVSGLLLTDEPLTFRKIVGALFGLLGVVVIIGIDVVKSFDLRNLAQLAVLGAALSYSFASVWGKRFLSEYPPVVNAFGMLLGSTILMFPVIVAFDGIPEYELSIKVWSSILAVGVLSTALAYLLYFHILVRIGSANLMLVTLISPVFTIGFGEFILEEELSNDIWLGAVIIAVGFAITDGRLLNKLNINLRQISWSMRS